MIALQLLPKNALILDLGSGNKQRSDIVFRGHHIIHLDLWPAGRPDVIADAVNLPFRSRSFDCIYAYDLIEHLDHRAGEIALLEMHRVTRQMIIIGTPTVWSTNESNIADRNNPSQYQNLYNLHKSLWSVDDFPKWTILSRSADYMVLMYLTK